MLIRHVSQFTSVNSWDDAEGFKHLPGPIPSAKRIVYVYGEPREIFDSLKRRHYDGAHAAKLGSLMAIFSAGAIRRHFLLRAIRKQKSRFEKASQHQAIMLIDYSALWNNIEELAQFLGIEDPKFVADFPIQEQRTR